MLWLGLGGNFKLKNLEVKKGFARNVGIRSDGSYSTSALASLLGVGIYTIHYWRKKGILEAFQETPQGPWWHRVTPEILKTLREKIRRVPVRSE